MYCPKCGTAITEKLNYCRGCGFRLISVSQLLENDGQPVADTTAKSTDPLQLSRKELNVGAGLMYLGTLLALFVGVYFGGAHSKDGLDAMFALPSALIWYFITNAVLFASLLLGLRFSSRQKDRSLGATLMFIFSVLSSLLIAIPDLGIDISTVEQYGKAELVALTVSFTTILFLGQPLMQRLLRGLFNLFAAETPTPKATEMLTEARTAPLPPAQSQPADAFVPPDHDPYDVAPFVTEEPTRRLERNPQSLSQ